MQAYTEACRRAKTFTGSTHKKAIAMRVWRRSSPVEVSMEFYSRKGTSAIVEKSFGMSNASTRYTPCRVRESNRGSVFGDVARMQF